MSTEGLKAELVNRLQARLDEEEFGLAEPPPAGDPAPSGEPVVEKTTPPKEDKPAAAAPKKVDPPAKAPAAAAKDPKGAKAADKKEESSKSVEKTEEEGNETEKAPAESPEKTKVTAGMSFDEKKKARAARFQMPVIDVAKKSNEQNREQRKRKGGGRGAGRGGGDDRGKPKGGRGEGAPGAAKRQKKETATESFDKLSKEELEKRLERAKKFNIEGSQVDAMRAALRKHRFESK